MFQKEFRSTRISNVVALIQCFSFCPGKCKASRLLDSGIMSPHLIFETDFGQVVFFLAKQTQIGHPKPDKLHLHIAVSTWPYICPIYTSVCSTEWCCWISKSLHTTNVASVSLGLVISASDDALVLSANYVNVGWHVKSFVLWYWEAEFVLHKGGEV